MTRLLILTMAGALAACLEQHAPTAGAIDEDDCAACHLATYQATTAPAHRDRFPTTCGDCHVSAGWVPALAGTHPDDAFPITRGGHDGTRCLDCHQLDQGASTGGANTSCIRCHSQAENDPRHTAVPGYAYQAAQPHFCLTCHPTGIAGRHPEDRFPIAGGPHQMPCADCHRPELGLNAGGANTSCTGCHTGEHSRGRVDRDHDEVGGYAWSDTNQHFCLACHPRGRD